MCIIRPYTIVEVVDKYQKQILEQFYWQYQLTAFNYTDPMTGSNKVLTFKDTAPKFVEQEDKFTVSFETEELP